MKNINVCEAKTLPPPRAKPGAETSTEDFIASKLDAFFAGNLGSFDSKAVMGDQLLVIEVANSKKSSFASIDATDLVQNLCGNFFCNQI